MAPMAGVTDEPFRDRLRRNGCAALWTEMVSAAALVRKHKNSLKMCSPGDQGDDTAIQLFGSRPTELRDAAMMLSDLGWQRLDINMGCPVKKVVKSGAGAALMRDVELAAECIRGARAGFGAILTVKIRLGWSDGEKNYLEIGKMADAEGVDGLILHGRTKAQGYSGFADWTAIRKLAETVKIPVAGNGDVDSAHKALERLGDGTIAAVMVGRAALSAPWIFRDAERLAKGLAPLGKPTPEELCEDMLTHLDRLAELKGERTALCEMKKFAAWADKGGFGAAERRNKVMRASTRGDLEEGIRLIGSSGPEESHFAIEC